MKFNWKSKIIDIILWIIIIVILVFLLEFIFNPK